MSKRQKYTEQESVQNWSPVTDDKQASGGAIAGNVSTVGKKKRVRHRQTVKRHGGKLSVAVICANPHLRQFV